MAVRVLCGAAENTYNYMMYFRRGIVDSIIVASTYEFLRVAEKKNVVKEANVEIGRIFLRVGVTIYLLTIFGGVTRFDVHIA
jgi:hypothetical protein